MQNSGVGHVHFMLFVLITFALGSQREPSFQWNMGLREDNLLILQQNVASEIICKLSLMFGCYFLSFHS